MIIKLPTHTGIKFVALVLVVLFLTGCQSAVLITGHIFGGDIIDALVAKRDLNPNDLPIKSDLDVEIPINTPIVIHVNANTGSLVEAIEGETWRDREYTGINYPIWYVAERSALELFQNLSSKVIIDREIDKPDAHEELKQWYIDKAEGDLKSAYKLALIYHQEEPTNYPLAKKWYLKSDFPAARETVVDMWLKQYRGMDMPPDIKKANKTYRVPQYYCLQTTYDTLLGNFHKDQKLEIDTEGMSAYIFYISFDYCTMRLNNFPWTDKKYPLKTLIVVKITHTDGSELGEYVFQNNDELGDLEKQLRNVAYLAYNEVANKLVNSVSFVNHYQSLNKQ